jgi:uncharacterized repeat protein (TIGR03837 family)
MPSASPLLHLPPPAPPALRWDLFCRVIDNFGDLGVCWRLAAELAARGQQVRLWVDDAQALGWMAPQGCDGVELLPWAGAAQLPPAPADIVVEAFGCDPPAAFVARMALQPTAPLWINLEYLSAEPYVERSHGLRSPQFSGPGAGLDKWFFYPGFTPRTGGLLREASLSGPAEHQDATAALAELGLRREQSERCVSVFCYAHAPLARWVQALADQPTCLLSAPGHATDGLRQLTLPPTVRLQPLPWLTQTGYDQLLQACDLNIVRGEDSFVRAQWAGRPFVWHIYTQDDGAHLHKLEAFLALHLARAAPALRERVRAAMLDWNLARQPEAPLPSPWLALPAWSAHALQWRQELLAQNDLVSQLFQFVAEKR